MKLNSIRDYTRIVIYRTLVWFSFLFVLRSGAWAQNQLSNQSNTDVPVIPGLTLIKTKNHNDTIIKIYRNTSNNYNVTIDTYVNAFKNAGFTSIDTTEGGGWGGFGGRQAWGYKDTTYVKVNAQVQSDQGSVVYVCISLNGRPDNDHCDDD